MSKGVQIAIGATCVALLLGWYGVASLGGEGSFRYYQTLEEFRAAGEPSGPARVHGYVSLGSIDRDISTQSVLFSMQNHPPHAAGADPSPLMVRFASLETPDLFKDGAEVVVEGRLTGSGKDAVFHANKVFAKCPSKFEAANVEEASF